MLFKQLADGLAFLHSDDVRAVHRDVSLENCLLREANASTPHVVLMGKQRRNEYRKL